MIFLRKIIYTAVLVAGLTVKAAEPAVYDPFELNLEQNINTPTVPTKSQAVVKEHIDRLRAFLDRQGFKATKERRGEVLLITIPCSKLFNANESSLSAQGQALLKKFALPEEASGLYKILVAVHSDDTGEIEYTDNLTADRANAIDDFSRPKISLQGFRLCPMA